MLKQYRSSVEQNLWKWKLCPKIAWYCMGDSNLMQPLLHPVNNEDDGSGDGDNDVNNDDDDDERVHLRN